MQGIYAGTSTEPHFLKNGFGILQWKNFFNLLDVFILLVQYIPTFIAVYVYAYKI